MKHYNKIVRSFFTLILLVNTFCLFGQGGGQFGQGKAIYLVSLNYENALPFACDGELVFDEKSYIFTYAKDIPSKGEDRRYDEAQNRVIITNRSGTDAVGSVFYVSFERKKTVQRARFQGRSFVISDTLRTPEWIVLDESKEVEGMKCQKAKATVYGREYEVWFSSDIPLSYGPWKLNGLPGLILEAHSTDGEIGFELKEIHLVPNGSYEITPPSKGQHIEGYVNFFALQDRKAQDFLKATQATLANLQQSGEISSTGTLNLKTNVQRIEKTSTF